MNIFPKLSHFLKDIYHFIFPALEEPDLPPTLQAAENWRKKGVTIGENTHFVGNVILGRNGKDPIIIGSNCVLTGCSILGHDASTNRILGLTRSIIQPVVIEDDCFIGHGSIVLMGVTIGKGSIIGAGAIVTKDIEPGSVVGGNPARFICRVDELVEHRKKLMVERPEFFPDIFEAISH